MRPRQAASQAAREFLRAKATHLRERSSLPLVPLEQLLHPFRVSIIRQQENASRLQYTGDLEGHLSVQVPDNEFNT